MKLILVGVLLGAIAAGGSSGSDPPPPLLVVSSDYTRWSDDHVFAYRPGGPLRALALGSAAAASPDGRMIAFLREGALWTVRADGRRTRRVAALSGEHWTGRDLTWSPDGERVAVPLAARRTDVVDLRTGGVTSVEALAVGFSPAGARMAYVDADGLEVAEADGSSPRLVAPGWVEAVGVAWSPDGRWLAISATPREGSPRVALVRPDGSGLHALEVGGYAGPPAWSRGGRVAWVSPSRVRVAAPAGRARTLARVRGSVWPQPTPAWSRDGRLLALRALGGGIALVPVTGGGVRTLRPPAPAEALRGGVSWAGREVVFTARQARSDLELALVRADGGVLRPLTRNGFSDRDPSWSPDGRTIVFARLGARRGLYTIRVAGGAVRRLTRGDDRAPVFSPDGSTIAFTRGASIRLLDVGTRATRVLAAARLRPRQLSWTRDGASLVYGDEYGVKRLEVATREVRTIDVRGEAFRPVVSPDGTRIAFLGYRDERYFRDPAAWGIFVSSLGGTDVRRISSNDKFGPMSWSPDQTLLAASDGYRLELVDAETGGRRLLFGSGRTVSGAFRPSP